MFATLELPLRDDCRHKRLKVGRACHPCRMKKIKCDGKQPCMQCKARRRKCAYLKNPDETYIRLDPINDTSVASEYFSINMADPPPDEQLFSTPTEKPTTQLTTRSDKMIEQLTQGLVQLNLQETEITPWRSYGHLVRWLPEPSLPLFPHPDMPSRDTQQHLIQLFFDLSLPTLPKSIFYDHLQHKGSLITPLLLNAMFAHAQPSDLYYDRARCLIDDFLDLPRISTVIALILLALYDIRSNRGWMYSGMAIRMCLALGLHTANYSSQMSQREIELRKRVLWTCFILDKLSTGLTERPSILSSQDIALDYPNPLPEDQPTERAWLEGFNQLCKLMIILERTTLAVQRQEDIRPCLESVLQWRDRLPPTLQWDPRHQPHSTPSLYLQLIAYDLELSLVLCGRDGQAQRGLAATVSQVVAWAVQGPVRFPVLVSFSALFAALASQARLGQALENVRCLVEVLPQTDTVWQLRRLLDVALKESKEVSQSKPIEPADYTFELISVADEWARSLIY